MRIAWRCSRVTAWTSRPEDEHRLLSALLSGFVRHEYFPAELLKGALEGEEMPILLTVALPPADDRKIADTWSALGGELKPSLDVVVTAPLNIARTIEAGPPVLEAPRLEVVRTEDVPAHDPVATKRNRRGSSSTGNQGPATGERPNATTPRSEPGPAGSNAFDTKTSESEPDETFTAGARDTPGRRIRLRAIPRR